MQRPFLALAVPLAVPLAVLLAAPVAAAASGGGKTAWHEKAEAPVRPVEQLQGRVVHKDPANGTMKFQTFGEKVIEVRGTPQQIDDYTPDAEASIEVTRFDGERWLVRHPGAVMRGPSGTVSLTEGEVKKVDVGRGTLTLKAGGRTEQFRAHPQNLQGLQPGQLVDVTYGEVKRTRWVESLAPAPARQAPAKAPAKASPGARDGG